MLPLSLDMAASSQTLDTLVMGIDKTFEVNIFLFVSILF